jgi:hypothetical protein
MSEDKNYPKWKYHATKDPVVVQSKEEEKALGKGWTESPADFEPEADADQGGKTEPASDAKSK